MKITTPDGREFIFGENADEKYAKELVDAVLEAEAALAEGQRLNALPTGDWHNTGPLKTRVLFAQSDIEVYQNFTNPGYSAPAYRPPERGDALSPGDRMIIAELRGIRQAVLADREMYANPLTDELTRSRVVLPTTEEQ